MHTSVRQFNTPLPGAVLALALTTPLGACDDGAGAQQEDYSPSDSKGDIFGDDDRIERYQLESDDDRYELARSSAVLLKTSSLFKTPLGNWAVWADTLGKSEELCEDERFTGQPAGGFGSGTLVASDLLLTAGHNLTTEQDHEAALEKCLKTTVAFDFAYEAEGAGHPALPPKNVYQCVDVLAHEVLGGPDGPWAVDYAILKLDRAVVGRTPVKVRDGAPMAVGTEVSQIGHPSGIPQKVVNGVVSAPLECYGVLVNTDAFPANSGSGVFDVDRALVAGIMSASPNRTGHYIFDPERSCHVAARCDVDVPCAQPGVVAFDTPTMLSRLSAEVREKLQVVEVGEPSHCGAPGDSATPGSTPRDERTRCLDTCLESGTDNDIACIQACNCEAWDMNCG